jgi:L-alanine-DL-glutamate epimerase-like enolase superfamily enzyme
MAKAAVEMAMWDLFARQRGEPLARVLGGTRDRIASGVSVGIQPTIDDLLRRSNASSPPAIAGSRSRSSRDGTCVRSRRCARASAPSR